MKKKLIISVLFFLITVFVYPQIKTQTFLNKKKVFLGDFFEYNILLQYPNNISIKNFDIYEVIKDTSGVENFILYKKENKKYKSFLSNKTKEKFKFYIIATQLGKLKLNEFEIKYVDLNNNEEKTIIIPPIEIEVVPYPKPKNKKFDGEIIDIKKQIWVKNYIGIALLLIIIMGIISYIIYNYNKKPIRLEKAQPQILDPKEVALKKLDELWNKNYIEKGYIKEFYLELTEIVRWYIEQKYEINALELTTEELFLALKKKVFKNYNIKLKSFLDNADLAKFAKYVPEKSEIIKDFEISKELIE
ncbi:MAG: hypothetical protein RMJ67_03890 [Elusimicrobiota bacterium]|nr:hypothetical protein [Endomicrobiia bacterium]MDW8165632.1 hypothetical protein [Elusimicrobiota bacterium]